jgi:hypothetical protein
VTLAYVFWHRPAEPADYENALARFHAALAADPPAGFVASAALRLHAPPPWLPGAGPVYEDWYLVTDWTAVGALDAAAAAGSRAPTHDAVAHASGDGAGALYGLVSGPARPPEGGRTAWLSKPAGVPPAAFHATLAGQVWRRRMVLGPAPEYAVVGEDVAGAVDHESRWDPPLAGGAGPTSIRA